MEATKRKELINDAIFCVVMLSLFFIGISVTIYFIPILLIKLLLWL
jgi:hypothetical protein